MLFDTMDPNGWRKPDDYRMSLKPVWFNGFWNYQSCRTLRSLERMTKHGRLPQASVFYGPPGSGKTETVHGIACWLACEAMDQGVAQPCGQCNAFLGIRFGRMGTLMRSLFEIDAAYRDGEGNSHALRQINEAYELTNGYGTCMGVRGDKSVVFIDEVQRMSPQQRTALLKLIESWPGAYVILATTVLEGLSVVGEHERANPLISHAELFEFSYPTLDECVNGLIDASGRVGLELELQVAGWIARKHACCPRDCLGELYRLSSHGDVINKAVVLEEYGDSAWRRWLEADNANDDGDDELMMVM